MQSTRVSVDNIELGQEYWVSPGTYDNIDYPNSGYARVVAPSHNGLVTVEFVFYSPSRPAGPRHVPVSSLSLP